MIPDFVIEGLDLPEGSAGFTTLFHGPVPTHRRTSSLSDFESEADKYSQYAAMFHNLAFEPASVDKLYDQTGITLEMRNVPYPKNNHIADCYILSTMQDRIACGIWFGENIEGQLWAAVIATSEAAADTIMVGLKLFAS